MNEEQEKQLEKYVNSKTNAETYRMYLRDAVRFGFSLARDNNILGLTQTEQKDERIS